MNIFESFNRHLVCLYEVKKPASSLVVELKKGFSWLSSFFSHLFVSIITKAPRLFLSIVWYCLVLSGIVWYCLVLSGIVACKRSYLIIRIESFNCSKIICKVGQSWCSSHSVYSVHVYNVFSPTLSYRMVGFSRSV